MNIIINGKTIAINAETTLSSLIQKKCPNPQRVISEVNERIIKRHDWDTHALKDGDQIELITFVGGG